jgi:arylsulfatase A-like enzyme
MQARRHRVAMVAMAAMVATPLALVTAAAALLTGCPGPRYDPARPDVILIVVDTLRADHLGAYGYPRPTSPRIDAFAAAGVVFDAAWSAAPWTLPSIMSIMTSRYPSNHRVENDGLKLAADVPLLAETLRARGYATGAFVSHVYVSAIFGFGRGFETFEDFGLSRPGYRLEAGLEPRADAVTDGALRWLKAQRGRPAFLFVHYFDPHWPYDPPAVYRERFPSRYAGPLDATFDSISKFQDPLVDIPADYRQFLIDRYDGEVAFTDAQIGRLLDGASAAGRAERAWVVLTGDHGEEFKDHGSMGHGRQVYEESIRVPLVVGRLRAAGPATAGGPAGAGGGPTGSSVATGRHVTTPVSGIDLFPTIAALTGAAPPAGLQGRSLVDLIAVGAGTTGGSDSAGAGPPPDRPLVSETVRLNAYRKAIRRDALKMIHSTGEERLELYDLAADPLERRDLSAQRPQDCRALTRALFAEVDMLSGGWNLRWSGDGRPHRFQGEIKTTGIFRSLFPVARGGVKHMVQGGSTLVFDDDRQSGENGLTFTTAPYEAQVEFYLLVDGRPLVDKVFLGEKGTRPRALPFTLAGEPPSAAAFARPAHAAGGDLGYYLWRIRPAAPDQEVILDDEIRERLRSLGYVN